jgi:hypothetical protein
VFVWSNIQFLFFFKKKKIVFALGKQLGPKNTAMLVRNSSSGQRKQSGPSPQAILRNTVIHETAQVFIVKINSQILPYLRHLVWTEKGRKVI